MANDRKRILILCKTYPSPSARHVETSCVAGVDENGQLIRLFPVPFRLVEDPQKFKKWQWIEARVVRSRDDRRPESHRISVDTIELQGDPLPTNHEWLERRRVLADLEVFGDFGALQAAQAERGISLALLRPSRLTNMAISKAGNPDWTDDEVAKLMQDQMQGSLFDEAEEQRSLKLLKKLPYDFHYHYECDVGDAVHAYKHKLVDWEAGALFWNVHRKSNWEEAFRNKFFAEFAERDVLFLMGTIHRFPDQWLIVSVLYPPKPQAELAGQKGLF